MVITLYAQTVLFPNTPALLHMALISDERVAEQVGLQKLYSNNNNYNKNDISKFCSNTEAVCVRVAFVLGVISSCQKAAQLCCLKYCLMPIALNSNKDVSLFQALVSKCAAVKQSAQLDEEEEASSVVLKEDNGITFIPLSSVSSPPFASFSCPVARRLPPPPSPFYPNHPPYNTLSPPHQLPAISHCLIQYLSRIFPSYRAKCRHVLCYYCILIFCILLHALTTSNHISRIFHHTDFTALAVGSNLSDFPAFEDRHAHL